MAALIIGAGSDVGSEHYGGDLDARVKADPERDRLESEWIGRALENGIPLLGICRGAQLINVVLGGTLHQDIRPLRKQTYNRPGLLPTKQVRLEPDSLLAGICGKTRLRVNSLHHQAIRDAAADLKEGVAMAAQSIDSGAAARKIETVARDCGYSNSSNLSCAFKKDTGMSPRTYRSKYRRLDQHAGRVV